MTGQRYEVDIFRENVISGNDALFKCSIPSFVSDFVSVQSWIDSEGGVTAFGSFGNSCTLVIFRIKGPLKAFPMNFLGKGLNTDNKIVC